MQEVENTKDVTIFGEKPKTENATIEVAENSTPKHKKISQSVRAKGIEIGNASERLQIAQQAIRMLKQAGVSISQKQIEKPKAKNSQQTAIILVLDDCSICQKCGWWSIGATCKNVTCEEFAKNLADETIQRVKELLDEPKTKKED